MKTLVNVQTQIDKNIREQASRRADELGFGSLQDAIRYLVYSFASGDIVPTVTSKRDMEREQWEAQIKQDYEDIARRQEARDPTLEKHTAHSVEELMQKLTAYEE